MKSILFVVFYFICVAFCKQPPGATSPNYPVGYGLGEIQSVRLREALSDHVYNGFIEVNPNSTVHVTVNYYVWNGESCPTCIDEIYLGMSYVSNPKSTSDAMAQLVSVCRVGTYQSLTDMQTEWKMQMPSFPGSYVIGIGTDWNYACYFTSTYVYTDCPQQGIAYVCVKGDSDHDGIYDCFDNCPCTYNPDQTDSNDDGEGDACSNWFSVTPPSGWYPSTDLLDTGFAQIRNDTMCGTNRRPLNYYSLSYFDNNVTATMIVRTWKVSYTCTGTYQIYNQTIYYGEGATTGVTSGSTGTSGTSHTSKTSGTTGTTAVTKPKTTGTTAANATTTGMIWAQSWQNPYYGEADQAMNVYPGQQWGANFETQQATLLGQLQMWIAGFGGAGSVSFTLSVVSTTTMKSLGSSTLTTSLSSRRDLSSSPAPLVFVFNPPLSLDVDTYDLQLNWTCSNPSVYLQIPLSDSPPTSDPIRFVPGESPYYIASSPSKESATTGESIANVGSLTGSVKGSVAAIVTGAAVGGIILLVLLIVGVWFLSSSFNRRRDDLLLQEQQRLSANGLLIPPDPIKDLPFEDPKYAINYPDLVLEQKLGEGAFGVVWKAMYHRSPVAVKQLKESESIDPVFLRQFLKEAELMRTIQPHRNVVQFLGICTSPVLCIVTEYMERGSLADYLKSESKIGWGAKTRIIADVASGMAHLASQNIVHKDLAARNVLLTEGLVAKVSDFGLSRTTDQEGLYVSLNTANGPLKWMAPESLYKKIFSTKSDVWSFGVFCIEVCTRDRPYPYWNLVDFYREARSRIVTPVKDIPADTPQILSDLMKSCWNPDPNDRPTFNAICDTLSHAKVDD